MLRGLGLEIGQVDVAVGVAGHHHHVQAGHGRAGRVGPVGRGRDQADPPVLLAAAGVVGLDGQQAGQLTLRPGVGLQRDGVVAGDLGQGRLEAGDQLVVAGHLVARCEGVDRAEARPRHRDHLGGGVELHGARAQRDHRPVQRDVPVGQPAQVAQHRRLRPVLVEHRVGQELRGARQRRRGVRVDRRSQDHVGDRRADAERGPHRLDDLGRRGLVQADADRVGVDDAQVDPPSCRGRRRSRRPGRARRR